MIHVLLVKYLSEKVFLFITLKNPSNTTELITYHSLSHWESSSIGAPSLPPGKFCSLLLLPPLPVKLCCILAPAYSSSSARTQHLKAARETGGLHCAFTVATPSLTLRCKMATALSASSERNIPSYLAGLQLLPPCW